MTAVPGFLQVTGVWRWVLNNTVGLVSGAVTGFGFEVLAAKISGPKADGVTLQLVGILVAFILLP
eukprot:6378558-Amphidinium_carterae.1